MQNWVCIDGLGCIYTSPRLLVGANVLACKCACMQICMLAICIYSYAFGGLRHRRPLATVASVHCLSAVLLCFCCSCFLLVLCLALVLFLRVIVLVIVVVSFIGIVLAIVLAIVLFLVIVRVIVVVVIIIMSLLISLFLFFLLLLLLLLFLFLLVLLLLPLLLQYCIISVAFPSAFIFFLYYCHTCVTFALLPPYSFFLVYLNRVTHRRSLVQWVHTAQLLVQHQSMIVCLRLRGVM